ncbi:MAG TPA: serine/threonine-protein kinase, partial [Acidimicrobiales bacterium]|nr:serine/threonine-protein kinase [Acidimicrobiales bacterium]
MAKLSGPVLGDRLLGERYRQSRVLKESGAVTTVAATDEVTGQQVVIKVVGAAAVSAGARMRLAHEAEVLRRLDSPRLASVLDVVLEDDLLLLVMPYAEGVCLDERLRSGPLAVPEAVALAIELFGALGDAHTAGVMHRDVKPANIVVSTGGLTLVDFGLARTGWLDCPLRDLPVGTARYVSPEQAGLLHHEVDERADLYSAGVVLFECLAGRPLFDAAGVGEVLRAQATARPPRLRGFGLEVPGALDEIVQRLLRKDPNDRYQTAGAVVADLEQLAAAMAAGVADPAIVIGAHDERRTITEPSFVGRSQELALLAAELDRARNGDGALVLLEAESGGGKSRLLAEFAQRSGSTGAWVLRGQGLDHVAVLPFQILAGVADEMVATASGNTEVAAALIDRLSDHLDGVRAALPALDQLLPASGATTGPEEFGPVRVAASLTVLLDALGDESRPALVLLDDCQWADEPTLRLLERWATARRSGGRTTMVVAAFRSEEVGADHPLRRVSARLALALPPFGEEDVQGLIESMAGP